MHKLLKYLLISWVIFPLQMFAQNFGNEWINTNQSYYRFSIPKTGIYKVTNAQLQAAGIPLSNFSPQNIQLFYNGEEIPCHIEGESQGLIEYVLFYAEKNNGWFDLDMYDNPTHQTNPNYSMINDTAAVFFTWNTKFDNSRFALESDVNFNGYTPQTYCWATSFVEYTQTYYPALEDCEYVEGEGWFDNQVLNLGGQVIKKLPTPDFIDVGLKSKLDLAFISFSKETSLINNTHHIVVSAPDFNIDTVFTGYKSISSSKDINVSGLTAETEIVFKSIDDKGATSSKIAASFINLKYTRSFNADKSGSFEFTLPASSTPKSYIEISGFVSEGSPYLFDVTNSKIIKLGLENDLHKALIPASVQETQLYLGDENYFYSPVITKSTMVNHGAKNKDYLILSHSKLWESALEYASYRNAYLVNVEELYNQFGYGIQKHPMALRNFLNFVYHNWTVPPEHFFILGKGVESYYMRNNNAVYNNCLIPTMGHPGSDALLSNRISGSQYESTYPTGRLAAQSNSDVYLYLNKVQEFEQNRANEWMKRVIHFGGGSDAYEQGLFKNYLSNYEKTVRDSLFGGFVSTFLKTSSDPIVISKDDSIKSMVNNGVSLMTFFGHGSAQGGFDQNIDEPSSFNNKGKYPLMITNSCFSGNIHLNGKTSKSEDWVLIPDKGSIGFFAVVGGGYASYLNIFSDRFYENFSNNLYGKTIGQCINDTRKQMAIIAPNNRYNKLTTHEFTLHGDPAIVLNSFPLPDLIINDYEVSFSPKNITTEIDSFYMQIVCTNQAKTTSQTFTVEIGRLFQTGKTSSTYFELNGLFYKDTTKIKLPVDKINGLGNNKFTLSIDVNKSIPEYDETNNTVAVNTFISSTDVVPVFPYKYSINSNAEPVLKTSSVDAFADNQTTIFQIDTTYLFNSPLLYSEGIQHSGGIVEWQPPISWEQKQEYFWRVAKDSEDKKWAQSSFVFENNKRGWHQSTYGQLRDNNLRFLDLDDEKQEFDFTVAPKTLICKNIGSPGTEAQFRSIAYGIDGVGAGSSCGAASAMMLVVIDSLTLLPWQSDYKELGEIGHVNDPGCYNTPQNYFIFQSDVVNNIENLVNFVDEEVTDGHYLLIYSFRNGNYGNYTENIRSKFESWGANNIRFLSNNIPYIFFVKKGDLSSSEEVIGATTTSEIDLYKEIKGNFTYGAMESTIIGPSKKWETLNWDFHKKESSSEELTFLQVYGIDNADNETVLFDSILEKVVDLTTIPVANYPYLKLQFYTKDEEFRTPSHLDFWQVLYAPVTDLALNPQKGMEFKSDTLTEGEEGMMAIAIENIGLSDVDSVGINYWIQNDKNEVFPLVSRKLAPLKQGESRIDSIEFSTLFKQGNNSLWVEINPASTLMRVENIREQYYFNNLAQKSFYIVGDNSNPLLDVTFDGLHIMDGDIVSARPQITIQLKDENQYIPLNDTSLFSFYVKSQRTGVEKKISINDNSEVVFVPAELPDNKAQIIYSTHFADDGIYELRVQAKDFSGNESGVYDFLVSFQIINESTITNVFNYPNPFSTSTRFVFEVTGSVLPDALRIEILTVTGKVVKVIYLEELGPIQIGKNITEYFWNGTDMYGDRLANGVYFYRVNARINGEELKIRDTGTSQYFKNGFGKMYLMR